MNTQKYKYHVLLAITTVLAFGVLTGCQYCEPLLMAALAIGAVVISISNIGMAFSPFTGVRMAGTKHANKKL